MTAEEAKAFEHANIILQALGVQERVDVVLSQVTLRKGDVVLLCSDGLHGPVADEEILADPDRGAELQKAGEAPDPEGPRPRRARQHHRGAGSFRRGGPAGAGAGGRRARSSAYDPGGDPIPEGLSAADSASLARETVEERLPRDMLTADDIPTRRSPTIRTRRRATGKAKPRSVRSLLALFLLALVAAAAGGMFVMKCEHDPSSKVTLP